MVVQMNSERWGAAGPSKKEIMGRLSTSGRAVQIKEIIGVSSVVHKIEGEAAI